jgi:hypothetical protein
MSGLELISHKMYVASDWLTRNNWLIFEKLLKSIHLPLALRLFTSHFVLVNYKNDLLFNKTISCLTSLTPHCCLIHVTSHWKRACQVTVTPHGPPVTQSTWPPQLVGTWRLSLATAYWPVRLETRHVMPDPVPNRLKGGESSQWWRCRRSTHGSGREGQAAPKLQAGWLAVLMPDPLWVPDGDPVMSVPGVRVTTTAVTFWAVKGVVTAVQYYRRRRW